MRLIDRVHLPAKSSPTRCWIRDFFVRLFRAAIGAPDGFGRSAFVVMVNPGHPVLCTLPGILSFTLPMGVLVGVLIALGPHAADSELIAMSALGLGRRRLLVPIGILARAQPCSLFA